MFSSRAPRAYDHINGRDLSAVGKPGEIHSHAYAPRLRELRESLGLTLEQAAALTTYGSETLRQAEAGSPLPRIVLSRLTAEIGSAVGNKGLISHARAKGEVE